MTAPAQDQTPKSVTLPTCRLCKGTFVHNGTELCPDCTPPGNQDGVVDAYVYQRIGKSRRIRRGMAMLRKDESDDPGEGR